MLCGARLGVSVGIDVDIDIDINIGSTGGFGGGVALTDRERALAPEEFPGEKNGRFSGKVVRSRNVIIKENSERQ